MPPTKSTEISRRQAWAQTGSTELCQSPIMVATGSTESWGRRVQKWEPNRCQMMDTKTSANHLGSSGRTLFHKFVDKICLFHRKIVFLTFDCPTLSAFLAHLPLLHVPKLNRKSMAPPASTGPMRAAYQNWPMRAGSLCTTSCPRVKLVLSLWTEISFM